MSRISTSTMRRRAPMVPEGRAGGHDPRAHQGRQRLVAARLGPIGAAGSSRSRGGRQRLQVGRAPAELIFCQRRYRVRIMLAIKGAFWSRKRAAVGRRLSGSRRHDRTPRCAGFPWRCALRISRRRRRCATCRLTRLAISTCQLLEALSTRTCTGVVSVMWAQQRGRHAAARTPRSPPSPPSGARSHSERFLPSGRSPAKVDFAASGSDMPLTFAFHPTLKLGGPYGIGAFAGAARASSWLRIMLRWGPGAGRAPAPLTAWLPQPDSPLRSRSPARNPARRGETGGSRHLRQALHRPRCWRDGCRRRRCSRSGPPTGRTAFPAIASIGFRMFR